MTGGYRWTGWPTVTAHVYWFPFTFRCRTLFLRGWLILRFALFTVTPHVYGSFTADLRLTPRCPALRLYVLPDADLPDLLPVAG